MTADNTALNAAAEYLANPRFHQTITIPSGGKHGDVLISYSECGHLDSSSDAETPTILFTPGMFGSRYLGTFMHAFGQKHGVRVLVPDRFGFGKTPNVGAEDRIKDWVAILPKFLEALGIKHVALASHSAGTLYNMNLLWHSRQILHPQHPMVFFFAPFVDGACSSAALISSLQVFPVFALSQWNKLAKFFVVQAGGTIEASSGILGQMAQALTPGNQEPSDREKNMRAIARDYGPAYDTQVELERLMVRGMFDQETAGANWEAVNCLKKGPKGAWDEADNMHDLVDRIASREKETHSEGQAGKLTVSIYFAESDVMTGKKGQDYFRSCWVDAATAHDQCVDIQARTIEKTNHDSVLTNVETLADMFKLVSEMKSS
uniref:AB hydrolase-1 domain-containing protein n=1 Tax=Bionectria ochroleuca TaxID=29856 RepID=A0A8H7THW0_BIOOC